MATYIERVYTRLAGYTNIFETVQYILHKNEAGKTSYFLQIPSPFTIVNLTNQWAQKVENYGSESSVVNV